MLLNFLEKNIKSHNYICYFIPFILGLLISFSLPPYNFTFINFIAFPFLLILLLSAKKTADNNKIFFLIGWFFGLGFFLSSLYWISIALTHDNSFKILIPFALIIIPSFLAIFYGIVTIILRKLISPTISFLLLFSLLFAFTEYIRGNILSGFPWNLFAYSWSWSTEIIQLTKILGTYGLNLLSITIFSFPFIFFVKAKRTYILKASIVLVTTVITIFLYGISLPLKKIDTNFNDLTMKIVSPNIELDQFFKNDNDEITLKKLIKLSNPEKELKTIFIWPEGMFSSTYLNEIKKYKDIFSENFSDNHIIIFGIFNLEYFEDKEFVYNSLLVVDHDLNILGKYNKNKLVPFGEFLPYENFFKKLGWKKITHGYKSFTKGNSRNNIKISKKGYELNFLPLICYEIIYPGALNTENQKINFIINISEDGWFGNSIGPHQHFTHALYRAVEEGVFIARSTNNGISAFISPNGKIIKSLNPKEKGTIEVKIPKYKKNTPFSRYGNKIFFLIILLYIFLTLIFKKFKI